ncbi:MAG: hypothetical protein KJZ78_19035 [Bryobacteraceae bacterium]|nr:hypothetical protein [Bryobacteraceae bacterium]
MRVKLLLAVLGLCLGAFAQMKMTVAQLHSFVKSSVELRHEDRRVAEYLRKTSLTERLDTRAMDDLRALGPGPRTLVALEELQERSKALPAPQPVRSKEVIAVIEPPSPAAQEKLINDTRNYAMEYVKRLPDFICTQVTRRYVDPTGLEFWQRADVVTARLTYFEQKEDYKVVLVNNTATDTGFEKLGGATSTGEFGSMLREVFDPKTDTAFRWERWATLRGRRMHVLAYQVAKRHSEWNIRFEKVEEITPGYRGLVYVDRDTGSVMRITLEAVDIPPSFPIQQASQTLDYDLIDISGANFVLPLKSVMRMRHGRFLVKNETEFRMYRKFGAEAVITFDTPEPLPDTVTEEQPLKP